MTPVPTILDVDTGVDDMVALLLAAASPEVELVAATCVTGNVHVSKVARNTLHVLELAGLPGVEVAAGADLRLEQPWEPFPVVHGEEGLGAYEPPEPEGAPSGRTAVDVIVDTVRERPGEILLVATGPLTNVAAAVESEPALPEMLRGFTLMGGAFREGGNVTPRGEANVWMDPEAGARVFDAWAQAAPAHLPRCLGLDVTEKVVMTRDDVEAICRPGRSSPLAVLLRSSIGHYIDFYASTTRFEGACMHDPLALAAAIDPDLCTWAETRVEIELNGRFTRGDTVTDLYGIRRSPWSEWDPRENAVVATSVDAPAALERIVHRVRSLMEARA